MSTKLDYDKVERSVAARRTVLNTVIYGLLILWALIVLFPFTGCS